MRWARDGPWAMRGWSSAQARLLPSAPIYPLHVRPPLDVRMRDSCMSVCVCTWVHGSPRTAEESLGTEPQEIHTPQQWPTTINPAPDSDDEYAFVDFFGVHWSDFDKINPDKIDIDYDDYGFPTSRRPWTRPLASSIFFRYYYYRWENCQCPLFGSCCRIWPYAVL